jgi:hypothetical protein
MSRGKRFESARRLSTIGLDKRNARDSDVTSGLKPARVAARSQSLALQYY